MADSGSLTLSPAGLRRLVARRMSSWTPEATALTLIVAALTVLGLVMSFSASFVDAAQTGDPFEVFRRQLVWVGVGIPLFLAAAHLPYRVWRGLSWPLIIVSVVLLALVLGPAGVERSGSQRWLALGPLVMQPSELAKLATLLWLADVLQRKRSHTDDEELPTEHLLIPAVPLLVIEAGLILAEPDLGTALLVVGIVGLILLLEGLAVRHLATGLAVTTVGVGALTLMTGYRAARLAGWLHPDEVSSTAGFQLLQSLYALGSGGWFGVGLGGSRGKWNFIPNPETDFIFAIIGEELGLVGALVVLALFAALLVLGLRIARRAGDSFGRTVAFAITGWLVGQALLNVATVTGLLPITGVPLPLVSVGGSSLVTTLVALGILASIARRPGTEQP